MTTHKQIYNLLAAFALNELPEREAAQVKNHLSNCRICRAELKRLETLLEHTGQMKEISAGEQMCELAEQSLLTAIADEKAKRQTAGQTLGLALIRSTIMKSKITKLTAAAMLTIAITAGLISILTNGATPAWAIEQTVEALKETHSLKISGIAAGVVQEDEVTAAFVIWAIPNDDETGSEELRYESDGFCVIVVQADTSYNYVLKENTVYIRSGSIFVIKPWLGSKFFQTVKQSTQDWEESFGQDEESGRECVFVTCSDQGSSGPKSWWFQFDLETKLPVRFKQWNNIDFEGEPQFYGKELVYDPQLPEGIFEFEIPEGAQVVDERKSD